MDQGKTRQPQFQQYKITEGIAIQEVSIEYRGTEGKTDINWVKDQAEVKVRIFETRHGCVSDLRL